MTLRSGLVGLALITLLPVPASSALRDGRRFDPADTMTTRAAGAPEELDQVTWLIGHWAVEFTRHFSADSTWTASGRSDISFMNRGHALMERFHCADFDGAGNERNWLSFLVYNTSLGTWGLGVADSWRENIVLYNGEYTDDQLTLRNATRLQGNLTLTEFRLVIEPDGNDAFQAMLSATTDGETFNPSVTLQYSRLSRDDGLFTAATGLGEAAPDLPEQARQFDFLLGEWDLQNELAFPDGRQARWQAYGTAVRMLNGHCIMEYSSFDTDPNLPDAATTIVRLWNRQMRRWECMYMNNRSNGILHFGGVQESDRIVLHKFDSDASDVPISQWVFHSWKPDSYGWYGNASRDRGRTWNKTWTIEATKRK
jgi:hypothetical protein